MKCIRCGLTCDRQDIVAIVEHGTYRYQNTNNQNNSPEIAPNIM